MIKKAVCGTLIKTHQISLSIDVDLFTDLEEFPTDIFRSVKFA
jgi:hypothetical protein